MRIVTNVSSLQVYENYSQNQLALANSMEKLSTGLRINTAVDDPAGLAISEALRAQVDGTNSVVDTIANASNFLNTADGYLQSVNDMLQRMDTLAVSMDDVTLTTYDKNNVATEFNQLVNELNYVFTSALFNDIQIFGTNSNRLLAVDANGNELSLTASGALNTNSMWSITTSMTAGNILGVLTSMMQTINTQRASLGALQSHLNFRSTTQQTYSVNVSAAESRIRDTDIAKESSNLARNQILVQADTAMLAQANTTALNVLSLLR